MKGVIGGGKSLDDWDSCVLRLTEMEKNGNIRAKLGKRQRRGILHGASESRKLLGDAKQQTNSVELTSEPLLPNLE